MCRNISIPQREANVCCYFSSGKGSGEKFAGAAGGVEKDEGMHWQHVVCDILILKLVWCRAGKLSHNYMTYSGSSLKSYSSFPYFVLYAVCWDVFLTKSDSIRPLYVIRHQNLSVYSVHPSFLNFGLISPVGPVHKPVDGHKSNQINVRNLK